ncbi:DUF2218 domain-containing protein [Qipengyuania sp.]|uniref:DUF2218 domain-containing protein n=1 Tax=Qipengyuania sp. TaxID=2004515 RepID=UPI0035C821CA
MRFQSEARVATGQGKRYAAQLGKHWAHNLAVVENGDARRIVFPRDARGADWPGDGIVDLMPGAGSLDCRIVASAEGQLEALKGAVERHVDRFAFREGALDYHWHDG